MAKFCSNEIRLFLERSKQYWHCKRVPKRAVQDHTNKNTNKRVRRNAITTADNTNEVTEEDDIVINEIHTTESNRKRNLTINFWATTKKLNTVWDKASHLFPNPTGIQDMATNPKYLQPSRMST
jgi:hypothetical protein